MTEDYKGYIDLEYVTYATLNDAHELIKQVGMLNFLTALYTEKQSRLLTVEEQEAMEVLHNSWEL